MTRLCAVLAALAAALLCAPAALAATWTVNDNGDAPRDPAAVGCDIDSDPSVQDCTLRAAIETANATPGADTITFTTGGQAPAPAAALPKVTEAVTIDGGGNTTVTFAPAATGSLLAVGASDSTIKSITLSGGGANTTTVALNASGDKLDTVTVNAPATGVALVGGGTRVDGSKISSSGGTGIVISGANVTVASTSITAAGPGINIGGSGASIVSPEISGGGSDGIQIGGGGITVSGGHIHGNAGNGVVNGGGGNTFTHVTFYANGGKPIANNAGANGGILPPQNLRIGPRRADGTLPLTGNGNGTIELWAGDPSTSNAPGFEDSFSVSGDFTYNFPNEPAPGSVFALTLNGPSLGTSEFATVRVPDDVTSPDVTFARALDTNNVRVDFTEPIDPASVGADDFHLSMAGADRQITGVTTTPDNRAVILSSSGWKAGEAGAVEITGVGAVTDTAGNAMLTAPRLRVAAAPGDFIAPLGGRLQVSPSAICLTHTRNCRHTGMTIKFTTTEAGKGRLVIKRGDKTVGSRLYGNIVPGTNTLKWNGRLGSRKLRAGRYRLLMYVQDQVGNVTDQPPIVLFSVRRVTP